jgi:hypothetical protein
MTWPPAFKVAERWLKVAAICPLATPLVPFQGTKKVAVKVAVRPRWLKVAGWWLAARWLAMEQTNG